LRPTKLAFYTNYAAGEAMSVPGARFHHFAAALRDTFDVTVIAPRGATAVDGVTTIPLEHFRPERLAGYDAVVAHNLPPQWMRRLAHARTRVIHDLYAPYIGEYLPLGQRPTATVELLFARMSLIWQRLALMTGDAFACAGERQRDFWLGSLAALGRLDVDGYRRDPHFRHLVEVVRYGLPPDPPPLKRPVLKGVLPGIRPTDHVLLWCGGMWDWTDPVTPIRAVASLAERRSDVKLVFVGTDPPHSPALPKRARAQELARELDVLDRSVFFRPGWVPYDERSSYMLGADVGVFAHDQNLESRLAFRSRLLDYFWTGLPTITTAGDELGDVVARRALGRVVTAGDVPGWEAAIEGLLGDEAERDRIRARLAQVRRELAWPVVAESLARLVRNATATTTGAGLRLAAAEERWLRLRISLAHGGPTGALRRQTRKFVRRA
jgi:glycosyltransferase involved in cell wall biosynthesis